MLIFEMPIPIDAYDVVHLKSFLVYVSNSSSYCLPQNGYALNYGKLEISLKIIYLNGIMGDEHI